MQNMSAKNQKVFFGGSIGLFVLMNAKNEERLLRSSNPDDRTPPSSNHSSEDEQLLCLCLPTLATNSVLGFLGTVFELAHRFEALRADDHLRPDASKHEDGWCFFDPHPKNEEFLHLRRKPHIYEEFSICDLHPRRIQNEELLLIFKLGSSAQEE